MNPTPTDPREERSASYPDGASDAEILNYVKNCALTHDLHARIIGNAKAGDIAGAIVGINNALATNSKLAADLKNALDGQEYYKNEADVAAERLAKLAAEVERLKTACEKEFQSVEQLSGENMKLAAEIAELKAREEKALDEAKRWHQRLTLTDYAISGNEETIRQLCEEDAEFKSASQILSLQNARALRAELEAANAREAFLKSKGLTVGTLKASNHEPKLAYVIEPESELCDLRYIHENLDLKRELEAARKERDERKADLKMFMEMHDTALAAKAAAEKKVAILAELNADLRARLNRVIGPVEKYCGIITPVASATILTEGGGQPCAHKEIASQNSSTPTSPDKSGNESKTTCASNSPDVGPIPTQGELKPFDLTEALAGAKVVTRDGRMVTFIRKWSDECCVKGKIDNQDYTWTTDGRWYVGETDSQHDLFMSPQNGQTALTPAPTQEPPAGGVTISNDSSGGESRPAIAGADGSKHTKGDCNPQGSESRKDNPKIASESSASPAVTISSPADVPSEGRGELLPFNLPDALAGKPVVSRNGFPCEVRALTNNTTDYVAMATVDGWEFQILPNGQLYSNRESPLDCFMLPPEGSGA